ncbi:MAG: hypothetical protein IPK07_13475 [Deltaproteobacteria bacterium]|nr:hypothetical protein [Deltaproteobacteria bacterium]
MKSLVRRLATIGFVLGAGLAPLGCGSDSGSSGFDPLAGAGALAGAYDMTFQATVTFSAPPETPDQSFTTAALFTIEDGANGAVELTAVSVRSGLSCTLSLHRTSDLTAVLDPDQSCTTLFGEDTFKTATIEGSITLAGNTLSGTATGDVAGSFADIAYTGSYDGTWIGTKRP